VYCNAADRADGQTQPIRHKLVSSFSRYHLAFIFLRAFRIVSLLLAIFLLCFFDGGSLLYLERELAGRISRADGSIAFIPLPLVTVNPVAGTYNI
jgi:hypothetical protein